MPDRQSRHAFNTLTALAGVLSLGFIAPNADAQRRRPSRIVATKAAAKAVTVTTEPNALVWLDEVRRGTTDATGQLTLKDVTAGRHSLRVRAKNFGERALTLLPAQRGRVAVRLLPTIDAAELAFQQGEELRDKATDKETRQQAIEAYRRALAARPRFPAACVGLARVLLDSGDHEGALAEIDAARAVRPAYAEASAVEGRILRADGDTASAIASFRRAIREAPGGVQPEAHTGLGLIYEDKGDYTQAALNFQQAVAQLADTEPVLYQLLGAAYERAEKYKEAVAAYEKYLQLAPDGKLAPAIQSIIEQLRLQAVGEDIPLPPP